MSVSFPKDCPRCLDGHFLYVACASIGPVAFVVCGGKLRLFSAFSFSAPEISFGLLFSVARMVRFCFFCFVVALSPGLFVLEIF